MAVAMQISAELDQLRTTFSDCRAIAYADLGAQMILVTSTGTDMPQERWDELCVTAVALLNGEPARRACGAMVNGDGAAYALVLEANELGLFLKSITNSDDSILCVAHRSLPVKDFIVSASVVLSRIAQDD